MKDLLSGEINHILNKPHIMDHFRKLLLSWGDQNFQSYPWRETSDPYYILMAEIMLHRTQVKQVLPVYKKFLQKYPDIKKIFTTHEDQINKDLGSLGLHWRINLIKKMAEEICLKFNGIIPQEKDLLMSLPGISDYIASAVRSFAWNYPEAIIDTNTVRITSRIYGIGFRDSLRRNQSFQNLVKSIIDPVLPAKFNYSLLDLAHLVCHKKTEPQCTICPIMCYCLYGQIL